jgi:hypothetical protein
LGEESSSEEDWLIGPPFAVSDTNVVIKFNYYESLGDVVEQPLSLLITNDFTGDVASTTWTDVTPDGLDGSTDDAWITVKTAPLLLQGENLVLAFRYEASGTGTGTGTTKRIGVDKVCVEQDWGPLAGEFIISSQTGAQVRFLADFSGGSFPYLCSFDFGNGETTTSSFSEESCNPTYNYPEEGDFSVTATLVDAVKTTVTQTIDISVAYSYNEGNTEPSTNTDHEALTDDRIQEEPTDGVPSVNSGLQWMTTLLPLAVATAMMVMAEAI